ncbi:uncharacterized protein LOC134204247 [Armigeres subalbatus]|uniref:uncharacterized protein LOC134204247 n=1 Tax=Armigeres subalbatus TaxID=124917 RepID=UPI002ED0BF1E
MFELHGVQALRKKKHHHSASYVDVKLEQGLKQSPEQRQHHTIMYDVPLSSVTDDPDFDSWKNRSHEKLFQQASYVDVPLGEQHGMELSFGQCQHHLAVRDEKMPSVKNEFLTDSPDSDCKDDIHDSVQLGEASLAVLTTCDKIDNFRTVESGERQLMEVLPSGQHHQTTFNVDVQQCVQHSELSLEQWQQHATMYDEKLVNVKDEMGQKMLHGISAIQPHDSVRFLELKKAQTKHNDYLKLQLKSVRRRLFVSEQTSNRRLATANRNRRTILKMRNEMNALKKQKSSVEKLGAQAAANPVIRDFLNNANRRPKARRYHPATIKFAAGIYLSGPRTYRFIRNSKHIVLPHKSTVYNYNKNIRLEPGLNEVILNLMKSKVKRMRSKMDKIVMICIDGMSVKPELTYCAKSDTFYGFPNHGLLRKIEKNDPSKLATEAVVVMVSGIYRSFKQPIGYLLAHNSLGSEIQMKFIKKTVKAIRETKLIPIALVMDQSTTNQKMAREVGATMDNPIIKIHNENIAIMFDTPHLLKNARNALYKYNAVFDNQIASFKHIKHLYEIDVTSTLRLVPKFNIKLSIFRHSQNECGNGNKNFKRIHSNCH